MFYPGERINRDSVGQVESEGEDGVIDNDEFFLVAVHEDVQVFDEDFASEDAGVAVEAPMEEFVFGVDEVDYGIGVRFFTGCEKENLIKL